MKWDVIALLAGISMTRQKQLGFFFTFADNDAMRSGCAPLLKSSTEVYTNTLLSLL